jgi:hypothetical protein
MREGEEVSGLPLSTLLLLRGRISRVLSGCNAGSNWRIRSLSSSRNVRAFVIMLNQWGEQAVIRAHCAGGPAFSWVRKRGPPGIATAVRAMDNFPELGVDSVGVARSGRAAVANGATAEYSA